ncbi:hypothetical protein M406DRAFT_254924 [Cryphonectria parasitica EP155]|uniref:RSE1/DDB1/CPSF1 first beta-propeller domain-containing protein n=1 Tax=Cryphonectria parasitica (strain ATCC 38755 / EP155) TaxID=660469 RepID=A0A9P4Y782_CRYP1|nr:uncharacterized protein M406DRAFT_254924 [Cryphonectria parasitica EP155]KAF3768013.1 hypothetical protein M406DRAFT_254924 [Cryphonectria parasitica EP155]
MAFQSHVLENGQWVTRDSNLVDLLNKTSTTRGSPRQVRRAPRCGIMTRTVVQSPVAHWVLSVRLRSSQHNDVAFVGDHYVQIAELRRDGQLHNISRKCDFGSRIRNANVIGSSPVVVNGEKYATAGFHPDAADDDLGDIEPYLSSPTSPALGASTLPPQLLLVVLETGDCVFLFLRPGDEPGSFDFVALQEHVHSSRLVRPGFHLAVDPSSRFAVQACARNMFIVHELNSVRRLNDSYTRGLPLKPILSSRPRTVNGVIHAVEFLYPRSQDPQHIILLLIVVKDGVSRMITYDWMLGDDLREVFAREKNGHALPPQHEMPLMIIPLTVRSAFFAVSEGEVAYCADALQGSPSFEPCDINRFPPSEFYTADDPPLWTAWSRPPRLYPYHRDRDFIYMAREDGVVIYLECDSDDILGASFYHGTFCSVSTAFASLADEFHDGEALVNGETLVFGGDSGQGGVWRASSPAKMSPQLEQIVNNCQASPRKVITKLCRIPNWAPAVDFVTTAESSRWDSSDGVGGTSIRGQRQDGQDRSSLEGIADSVYAAAGRAKDSSIVEFRYGLQANIGIELDLGTLIRRCFMFQDNALDLDSGYHLLLSVAGRSALLSFDSRFTATSVRDVDQDQVFFDLSSPTLLAARVDDETILQVTEKGSEFASLSTRLSRFLFPSLGLGNANVSDATLEGDVLAVISHTGSSFQLHTIKLNARDLQAQHHYTTDFPEAEVTSFSLCTLSGQIYAAACLCLDKAVHLEFYSITGQKRIGTVSLEECEFATEPPTSLVFVFEKTAGKAVLVAGSRDGLVATVGISTFEPLQTGAVSLSRMGSMPVHVYSGRKAGEVFLCCDSRLVLASNFLEGHGFTLKQSVWTVDAEDSSKPSPAITSVTVLPNSLSGNEANTPLLLLATDHVLLAELQSQAGPVQRHLPLGSTPHKVLYSHVLKCLVVGTQTIREQTTLMFIDPETGQDLGVSANGQTKHEVPFISGLGVSGDRILSLEEWHVRSDYGHDHYYLLVSTRGHQNGGKIIIVSAVQEKPEPGQKRGKIRFWTRYKLKRSEGDPPGPISAVTTSGHKIQSSMGALILYHELDEGQKKITQAPSQEIGGPAWKLSILPGGSRTLALIKGDSLRVLEKNDDDQEPTMTHMDGTTRSVMDMLEVAGAWDEALSTPIVSDPPQSIVLVSDQNCNVTGLWIPWDNPGQDCEVLFETDLPSSVRRLRLGRVLPTWSRERRRERKFGLLPASVDGSEILGMGIDGSMQHFTLLDLSVWRLLRFVQNISETSPELYPFTYLPLEDMGMDEDDTDAFDPTPVVDRGLEMQVDGDLMQRCLEKRALEGLMTKREEWMGMFVEYLDRLDNGRWTKDFSGDEDNDIGMDGDGLRRRYFDLAYDILEYFLVPVL